MSETCQAASVEVRTLAEAIVVVLAGEHDLSSAPELGQTLTDLVEVAPHLIVDLSPAEFIDSSTITALLRAKEHSDAAGRRFNLVLGTAPIVERALEMTGVLPHLNTVRYVDDALAKRHHPEQ